MINTNKPAFRKLRGYAFDPLLSQTADTADINMIVYKIPWEDLNELQAKKNEGDKPDSRTYGPGPMGEYVEVIDFDPTIKKFYEPVDLNHPYILAQDGLAPSEGNPQFHQQMVYAVAMTTIKNFEKALGRKVLWAPRRVLDKFKYEEYVSRLRIYPHALREANAYYSPQKKALLFGYFTAVPANASLQMPGSMVFSCLSHDVIAHETTHAILDGMHRNYNNPTNPDVLAFHEAFADIVALFQHFTFSDVLKKQIAETRGDLGSQNLLGKLAQEFGTAIGSYGSLRDAIGEFDKEGKWSPKKPDVAEYRNELEPHKRGSILVAAVFEAFINIYKNRVADLLRIATNGTGILPQGELNIDLVNRLANEAAKAADHVLSMCIRAIDYCPPIDITFGEYLRAIITADIDLVADDNRDYRLFFIDAFKRRGIYPQGIKTLSVESLRYTLEPPVSPEMKNFLEIISDFLRAFGKEVMDKKEREEIFNTSKKYMGGPSGLHKRIGKKFIDSLEFEKLTGLIFRKDWADFGIKTSSAYKNFEGPSFQIQNLRLVSRVGPNGNQINQIVFSLIQNSGVIVVNGELKGHYIPDDDKEAPKNGFEFQGGSTLIFDLDTLKLKYAISRPLLDFNSLERGKPSVDEKRLAMQYNYQMEDLLMHMSENNIYFGMGLHAFFNEPFALLHNH